MVVHKYKPTSPGRRKSTVVRDLQVTGGKPEKSLLVRVKKTGGRNARGRITSHSRGGGHKRMFRIIDFRRRHDGVPARIAAIQYDPNRSANIALLYYADGKKSYIVAPIGLKVDDTVISGERVEPQVGNCMPLSSIPVGMEIHCVELEPGRGAQIGRSAGGALTLAGREGATASVILPSGEMRRLPAQCRATIGRVGNPDHALERIGKAGRNRWKGRRPKVRGSAMYPAAHPLGGGEGRSSPGRAPVSAWGKPAKGGKTRNPRKPSNRMIIRRRRKKR